MGVHLDGKQHMVGSYHCTCIFLIITIPKESLLMFRVGRESSIKDKTFLQTIQELHTGTGRVMHSRKGNKVC